MVYLGYWTDFPQHYFLKRQRQRAGSTGMRTIFKGKAMVLIVMGNIRFVMHDQKVPERKILDQLFMLLVVLKEKG